MPRKEARINFVAGGNDGDRVRGMEYFETQAEMLPDLACVGTSLTLERDRCGLYIVMQPLNVGIAERLEYIAAKPCPCHSIVDVHANFWEPVEGIPFIGGQEEVFEWSHLSGGVANLERAMKAADVVTVPTAAYVPVVEQFNPNIVVVPDVADDSEDAAWATAKGWIEALQIARRHKR